ncbi:MAG: DinB family protein [Gemmatimonadaceae bacterium]|nr:DinB family protein [Gemmatimonadaceae bacterium]
MPTLAQSLLQELEMEGATTRRVLERVPSDQLAWKPAALSRSLGELAQHIAENPGSVCTMALQNPAAPPSFAAPVIPTSTAEILATFDASMAQAREILGGMSDNTLHETWRMSVGGTELMAMPRIALMRAVLLNHWYHHRGQLSVYFRELNVPVPSIYGPSADENPFAPA